MNNINADIIVPVNPAAPERNLSELNQAVKELEQGINKFGTFEEKPTSNIYLGYSYFCTNRPSIDYERDGLMIYYAGNDGSNDIWIDALGKIIS